MRDYRFSASIGASNGVLHMTHDGIEFIPSPIERDGQLTMEMHSWTIPWDDVSGIERVANKRVQSRPSRSGALRIHHANFLRYITVVVHDQLDPVFVAVDNLTHAA